MDKALDAVVTGLASQGPFGIIILVMGWWIWKLQTQFNAVQEKRVADAFKLAEAAHTFAGAIERNTETLKSLLEG